MNRRSIAFKLFIITTVTFITFITLILVIQTVFFQTFYINRKTRILQKNINTFINIFEKNKYDVSKITTADLKSFEGYNNSQITILGIKGDKVTTGVSSHGDNGANVNRVQILEDAINTWAQSFTKDAGSKYLRNTNIYNVEDELKINNLVIITPIVNNNNILGVIFVVAPLQPIDETVQVMKEYYIYILIGAIILVLVLSFIYSNMISKPLIRMNKVAERMSELDFTTKFKIKSKDEIGNLETALNFLSEKLNSTLTELQGANEKLKLDLAKEIELEKMRKDFIAGVSHELKTPLSLIEGYTEGLKDEIVQGEEKEFYLDVIVDETKKMNALVSDMLNLSQLESGNTAINYDLVEVNSLLDRVVKKYTNSFKEKNIDLKLNLLAVTTQVNCDSFKIEQVLTNIIVNGIRHTPVGGVIGITLLDNGSSVLIEIENEGSHIPESDLTKIWERFYKVDKSRNRNLGGTGLGLAITKNILNLHHSSFGVQNTEKGVLFYFTLSKDFSAITN